MNEMRRIQQLSKFDEHCQVSTNVRSLPIILTEDEISSQRPEPLPTNRVCQTYHSIDEYLSTHFHLVREDCFASLRRTIQGFRKNMVPTDNVSRYKEVKFIGIQCGDQGLEHCILLKTTKEEAANGSSSKQLMPGSLLCISSDGFWNYAWGIVKDIDIEGLEKGSVGLNLIPSKGGKSESLEKHKTYEMIQSTAYYEAYVHVLKCLQRPEMKELPFWEHFLSLQPQAMEPIYLKKRQLKDAYNLGCAFPGIQNRLGGSEVHILQKWPQWNSTLDESQMEAVKQGLTKRLAIIQGPPGTGKTYVGLTIARILLSNIQCGPILVICYTNHALDQFLESIYSVEKNIVRVGGGSRNEIMLKLNLNVLKRRPSTFSELRVRHGELMRTKRILEGQIKICTSCVRATLISRGMLSGIASEQHINSLYSKKSVTHQTIEEAWLKGMGDAPVAYQDGGKRKGKQRVLNDSSSADISLDDILRSQDLWLLPQKSRIWLHNHWLQKAREKAEEELHSLSERYKEVCDGLLQHNHKTSIKTLTEAKVVGMTTTGAAKNYDLLQALRAKIVVIEEAAEVLEAHVLPCISSFTQHLILLGDHLQLRPSVTEYELGTKYKLDVSLFERLIRGGIEHVTLRCQRRMRPAISRLISDIYPSLQDHCSVAKYESIKGIRNDVFFLDHQAMESQIVNTKSKINLSEAKLSVELCVYLLRQGYKNSDITILTMYKGQMTEIQTNLSDRLCHRNSQNEKIDDAAPATPQVCSVDNYQGEECNIIILSLVRSNKMVGTRGSGGNIGFLKIVNRVCVALSRAKTGLYILGNAELLASKSTLWESIIQKLQSSNSIGPAITLTCQHHPQTEIKVSVAKDFRQMEDGGCIRPCEYKSKCGHACPFPTHCSPCQVPVSKTLPGCGHLITLPCSTAVKGAICNELCSIQRHCGHPCKLKCGLPCGPCQVNVIKFLPCGHQATLPCYKDPHEFICDQPCGKVLSPGCEHICRGTCVSCKQGTSHIPCKGRCFRDLPCGHQCTGSCSEICPPCKNTCQKHCLHTRCGLICGSLCTPCTAKCEWKCEHHTCNLLCHEICTRPRCDQPCQETLTCGHPCLGLCGEPCPKICRICPPKGSDGITQRVLGECDPSARFVELEDCGHVFEVSGLDTHMDMDNTGATAVKLKQCPECRSPIRRTRRYSNIVKTKLQQIEEVKKRLIGFEKVKRGNAMLKVKNYMEATGQFVEALSNNPGLLEAHLGQACALCGLNAHTDAIGHLSFIIEHSTYKTLMLPTLSLKSSFTTKNVCSKLADNELAIDALLQWALICSVRNNFATGLAICDLILGRNPRHAKTAKIRGQVMTVNRVKRQVVKVTTKEVGERGHWYKCPNGHFYVVGECGEPMQAPQCQDCKDTQERLSHATDNRWCSIM